MSRRLSPVGRLFAWLVRRLVPSLDRAEAHDAAATFDDARRSAWQRSVLAWLAVWAREARAAIGTVLERRAASRTVNDASATGGWRRGLIGLSADARSGWRLLWRSPTATITSAVSVSVGVTATVLVFAVVYAVLWRPLPVVDPDRLVRLAYGARHQVWSYPDFVDATRQEALSAAAAFSTHSVVITTPGGSPREALGDSVSHGFFELAGVPLAAGRGFRADDPDEVAVVSYALAEQEVGGVAAAVGQQIEIQGRPHAIVGVAPARFQSLEAPVEPTVWYPIPRGQRDRRGSRSLHAIARLAPGATLEQVQAQLDATARRLHDEYPGLHSTRQGEAVSIRAAREPLGRLPAEERPVVLAGVAGLFGLAGLILVLAASNVANLLLGRATERRPEIAVRLALGAGRGRIVRQLLTESLVLAGASGLLAVVSARAATLVLSNRVGEMMPRALAIDVDGRVLLFAVAMTIGAGLLFGLAPALHASRFDLMSTIRRAGATTARTGLRRTILGVQVAGAVLLTATALLFLQSLRRTADIDLGFDPEGVVVLTVDLTQRQYEPERAAAFFADATTRLSATPGVEAVAWAARVPLSGSTTASTLRDIEGYEPGPGEQVLVGVNVVSPGYFGLVGVPIRAGREFTRADGPGAPDAIIVNEAFAERFWPGEHAVGRRVESRRVVGVARNLHAQSLGDDREPFVWYPVAQSPQPSLVAHVRTAGPAGPEALRLARVVNAIDPDLLIDARPMADVTGTATLVHRVLAGVFVAAGLTAVALATTGIYGVMAYLVSLRTRELGLRMALGAAPGSLVRRTLAEGVRMTLAGLLVGLVLAALVGLAARAALVGIEPADPLAFVGAVTLTMLAAAFATLPPARRAARLQPTQALRHD